MDRIIKRELVSIIVVNFNGVSLLEECLDSLLAQTYKEIEIIVVDNGSQDTSCEFIEKKYATQVKLIKNTTNTGFARGNNIGICEALGEYIILVNNDTKSDSEFIQHLVEAAARDEEVGMCATKLLTYKDPKVIDAAGQLIYKDGLNQGRGRFELDLGQYESVEEVIYPAGCGALYKRKMLDEIGLFDETFFAYGEDTDIGLRARLLGWKALYVPKAIIYHKMSQTGGQYSDFKLFFAERNRMFVIIKYYPLLFLISSFFYTTLRYWMQFLSIMKGKGASQKYLNKMSIGVVLRTLMYAYLSLFANLPQLLKKRFEIRSRKKISDREFMGLFERFGIDVKKMVYNN